MKIIDHFTRVYRIYPKLIKMLTCNQLDLEALRFQLIRVEVPITDHSRNFAPNLEKYKAVQIFLMEEDRKQEDCQFFLVILFLKIKIL